jgi:hypothetical protein
MFRFCIGEGHVQLNLKLLIPLHEVTDQAEKINESIEVVVIGKCMVVNHFHLLHLL